ncbi:gluconolactonase [Cryptococcus wingfieldii CBS 7118]|uniref:Gluconolactonase n=1 Tax=Cryptococcus wingfieldii CBS 7118 TaxID=1295528 RepID=A0A1E3K6Z8_9TREE|nr:gluconolactonase [Cryptococcus wingfieldii CBS 7118]ODO08633.1 gluconolactonase [Cryptococcus wingfieldii CBS 7118]
MATDSKSKATSTARMSVNTSGLQERGTKREETLPAPLGSPVNAPSRKKSSWGSKLVLLGIPLGALAVLGLTSSYWYPGSQISGPRMNSYRRRDNQGIPDTAQVISPKSFAVLDKVQPGTEFNGFSLFVPPGYTEDSLKAKPFHILDDSFYDIIGDDPSLTLLADSGTDPLFHEAVVWYAPMNKDTDEVFFAQNAGAKAAGTGMNKSAIVQKISLSEAANVQQGSRNSTDITTINSTVQVVNPNGGTAYRGKIIFAGEGQGSDIAPALYEMDPNEPYDTTVILNNFFGRQFNSLNDIAVNPRNKELYFTDVTYGYLQDFRPAPIIANQAYRFNVDTGAIQVVADGIQKPNGIAFSPGGQYAYISDTGISGGFWGNNYTDSAAIYRYNVQDDGSFENRKVFAFTHVGNADGESSALGNVYAGVGDGIHVFNPSGLLIGKIYLGETSANFAFAGDGKLVICAETHLFYATLAAKTWDPEA